MKLIKLVTKILLIVGIVKLIGAAGRSDYLTGIREYLPLSETAKEFGIAFLYMLPFVIVKCGEHGRRKKF